MEDYVLKIIGPRIDEEQNKQCKDNEEALDLALSIVASYPLKTNISVYHIIDAFEKKHKQYIGMVEHVVRRTL